MSSSLQRQHRWKQFWAATICAASFAGGTLVFGDEPNPATHQPATAPTGMAPIVSGESLRRLPTEQAKGSSPKRSQGTESLPPVVDRHTRPKTKSDSAQSPLAATVGPAKPVMERPAAIRSSSAVVNPFVERSKVEKPATGQPSQSDDRLAPIVTGSLRPIREATEPINPTPTPAAKRRDVGATKPTKRSANVPEDEPNPTPVRSSGSSPLAEQPVELPSGPPARVSPWMTDIRETLTERPAASSNSTADSEPTELKAASTTIALPTRLSKADSPTSSADPDHAQRLPSTEVRQAATAPAVQSRGSHLEALKSAAQGLQKEMQYPAVPTKAGAESPETAKLDRLSPETRETAKSPAIRLHPDAAASPTMAPPTPLASATPRSRENPPAKAVRSKPEELLNPHVSKPLADSGHLEPARYDALSKHAKRTPPKSLQTDQEPIRTPPHDHGATQTALQPPGRIPVDQQAVPPAPNVAPAPNPDPMPMPAPAPRVVQAGAVGPFEMIGESATPISVMVRRSMLLRTRTDIYRTAVVDAGICDVVQFTPREISIIGKSQGSTHVTFWFDDPNMQPVVYLVKVEPDAAQVEQEENKYKLLEDVVNEMFPDSKIQLVLVADKLIVKGQAKDSEEATQIMSIIRTQSGGGGMQGGGFGGAGGGFGGGFGGSLNEGMAADVLSDTATGAATRGRYQVIDMLRVPGVQQVALRVKIAELNRTAARGFGVDVRADVAFSDSVEGSSLFLQSLLNAAAGNAPALITSIDGDDIQIGIRYLQQQGVIRMLSEPTLVTMSGRPATFIAGGEFAVPTIVGSAGLNAVTTDFRAFGAIISFLPTVIDKDRMRLQVSPEFSQINKDLAVNGTPGLKTRAATTTVEMREGQTLAIAGLLEDNMNATTAGDLPFLARVFGRRGMQRAETELIILVTPELVHPMEPEEVPPLPGFDVTEPTNGQFFLHGAIEGNPTREYRSTVWPRLKKRYGSGGPAMTSGPFGHGN